MSFQLVLACSYALNSRLRVDSLRCDIQAGARAVHARSDRSVGIRTRAHGLHIVVCGRLRLPVDGTGDRRRISSFLMLSIYDSNGSERRYLRDCACCGRCPHPRGDSPRGSSSSISFALIWSPRTAHVLEIAGGKVLVISLMSNRLLQYGSASTRQYSKDKRVLSL